VADVALTLQGEENFAVYGVHVEWIYHEAADCENMKRSG
jgi:hypothetical protein